MSLNGYSDWGHVTARFATIQRISTAMSRIGGFEQVNWSRLEDMTDYELYEEAARWGVSAIDLKTEADRRHAEKLLQERGRAMT